MKLEALSKFKDGDFLLMIRSEEKRTETYYFLKTVFVQSFGMKYSAHQKIKEGEELLISNFKLPKIKL